jgi:hypothetical protein
VCEQFKMRQHELVPHATVVDSRQPRGGNKEQTADNRQQAVDSRQQAAGCGQQAADGRQQACVRTDGTCDSRGADQNSELLCW